MNQNKKIKNIFIRFTSCCFDQLEHKITRKKRREINTQCAFATKQQQHIIIQNWVKNSNHYYFSCA